MNGAHTDTRGGTFIIDRRCPVGRIKRASGTRSLTVFAKIQRRIDALVDCGDLETLRQVQRGEIPPIALVQMDLTGRLQSAGDRRLRRESAWLYAIARDDTGEVKIGIACDVEKRMAELQTGSAQPLRLLSHISGNRRLEKEAHRALAAHHIRGEWFRFHADILAWFDGKRMKREEISHEAS